MADSKPDSPSEPIETPPGNEPTPAPPAADPPAARIVVEGTKTEREVALELEKKNLEIRVAHLEDEKFRLKQLNELGAPPPPPPPEKVSWLKGATFFD